MRVCSTSEKLLRWEKESQVEKGLPITRSEEGLVGWRWRGAGKKGLLSLRVSRAHLRAVDARLSSQAGGRSNHGPSHLTMGEKLVSV